MQYIHTHDAIAIDFQMLSTGYVYYFCYKNEKKGIDYVTLSARYDNKSATEFLVGRGFPVPPADLVNTSKVQGEVGWVDVFGAVANAKLKGK